MAGEESLELKFRLIDGTDIGPCKYEPATTITALKESILAQWPQGEYVLFNLEEFQEVAECYVFLFVLFFTSVNIDHAEKENGPKSVNDMKLINAGKILENNKTLAESRVPVGELPGGVITMHVVVRPPTVDKGSEKPQCDSPKPNKCACSIL